LEGTPEDWQAIADRAEQFDHLDLEWWLEPLRSVLRQFVAAARGDVDRSFWPSLYKYHDESGGPTITGWISTLFPYLINDGTGLATHRNPYLSLDSQRSDDIDLDEDIDDEIDDIDIDDEIDDIDIDEEDEDEPPRRFIWITADGIELAYETDPGLDEYNIRPPYDADPEMGVEVGEDYNEEREVGSWLSPMPNRPRGEEDRDADFGWGPSISSLPSGISRAPFHWDYRDRSFDMEFLGGFVGVSQDKDTLAVKPEIGWAVREAPEEV
jgi:hypothetical protein